MTYHFSGPIRGGYFG